jgi:hypothetical protein
MMTGSPPESGATIRRAFDGATSVSTMAAILHKEPEPLQGPAEVECIIKHCLRKNPADRYHRRFVAEREGRLTNTRDRIEFIHNPSAFLQPAFCYC